MKSVFSPFLEKTPEARVCSQWNAIDEFEGIEALTFDGALYKGRKTKVFAYCGYPNGNSKEKFPAVVLVHGGGGVPFLPWIKQWNDRGYVAIAFSNTGDFPIARNAGYAEYDGMKKLWNHGLYDSFLEEDYTDAPDNDKMLNSRQPIEEQWMYHAISQTIMAHNVLLSDERVDPDRIGICGISWGGIITALTIGYDNRFAFAVPIYGSAYLTEALRTEPAVYFKNGNNPELWLAEHRLDRAKMPILWQCENSDTAFTLNSNNHSYFHTRPFNSATRMSAVHNMRHSHKRAWARSEPLAFADAICRCASMLPTLIQESNRVVCSDPNADIRSVRMFYLNEPMSYALNKGGKAVMEQEWQFLDLTVANGRADYTVNDTMFDVYFELTVCIGGEELITSIPYEKV